MGGSPFLLSHLLGRVYRPRELAGAGRRGLLSRPGPGPGFHGGPALLPVSWLAPAQKQDDKHDDHDDDDGSEADKHGVLLWCLGVRGGGDF
jgi:hypothetical protein